MLTFILGILVGSALCGFIVYWKRKTVFQTVNTEDLQNTKKQLDDAKRSLDIMLQLMVSSSEQTRASVKEAIDSHIESTTVLAETSAETLSEIALSMESSHAFFIETSNHINSLVTNAAQGEAVGKSLADINVEFKASSEALGAIEGEINEILSKASEINSIGQEAEMLALNAAIEAARAGDAGRGFAVVADSMKALAKSSQSISNEVQQIVAKSQRSMAQIARAISDKSAILITTSDELIHAFSNLKLTIVATDESIKNLDNEFSSMKLTIDERIKSTKTELEEMIRAVAIKSNEASGLKLTDLSPREAHKQLTSFDYLIDVRRPEEFNDELGHIKGAELITLQTDFPNKVKSLPKNKRYLFICRSGGRSTKAAQQALFNGISEVYNLNGGMIAWRKANL